ncbi:MAG: hypothetical protein Ct9H90mP16_08960 [Candidatus Poseidoniales archaeon]|nr:MAG: hypothetical protein Ct9H90mP16_08960 [Candidatus Poseidoniales archaeon]
MGPGSCNPIEEHAFLVEELAMWIHGILDTGWGRGVRRVQAEGERGLVDFITAQLTGIGGNESMVMQAISGFKSEYPELGVPWEWDVEVRSALAHHLVVLFSRFVWLQTRRMSPSRGPGSIGGKGRSRRRHSCTHQCRSELALRRAAKAGFIHYPPGAVGFTLTDQGESELNPAQRKGLDAISTHSSVWEVQV